MTESYAVVFRDGSAQAAGVLEIAEGRLRLSGRGRSGVLELEIPFTDLSEVHTAHRRSERLNGYATVVLERSSMPAVQVAPLGVALVPEIANLLASLTQRTEDDRLAVRIPLRNGCLGRARSLLAEGPPFDPASLGLSEHEVYLAEGEAIFLFRGTDVRARLGKAMRQPAVWRAGLAWERCFAGPPGIVETARLQLRGPPDFHWSAPRRTPE